MKLFSKIKTKNRKIADREFGVSYFIPYKYLWNESTLITKQDWLLQVLKVKGFSFETADDEDVDIRKTIRNNLWKSISSGYFGLYFHIIRRKQPLYEDNEIKSDIENTFANKLDIKWKNKKIQGETFVNDLYVTIIRKNSQQGISGFENYVQNLAGKADKNIKKTHLKEMYNDLEEMVTRVEASLNDYGVSKLSLKQSKDGIFSELLMFLGNIVNCGVSYNMVVPSIPVSSYISKSRLFFGDKAIECQSIEGSRYCAIASIKEYGNKTNSGMLDSFLQMPFEFVITQSFIFIDRNIAVNQMQLQKNRMVQSEDKAISQIVEIDLALDMATSGSIGFGKHHFTIMCIEDNLKALESSISLAAVELSNVGGLVVREKTNMEPCFWAQLPGNYEYIARKSTVNTLNLSSFMPFHNYPTGKMHNNFWGDAVTIFDTTSGTPFFFSFHIRDVGHTTIIGPTGAGKTVLMNFLCAQSLKFKPRMFFFDKDRGAEIFLRAIGGVYTIIQPSKSCSFNPLQLEDNPDNRTFLLEWLRSLVTTNGEKLNSEDQELLARAVEGNYKLKPEDRLLRNIAPFLGLSTSNSLAHRLAMWHDEGSHASVFDNKEDTLDFSQNNIFGFEMAELLKDKISLNPVLLYIFHKINISLDGTPTMIILDEAWALIDNEVFAPKIKDWLKVLRKLNAMVVFATQSVEDASKSRISDTLIQQTATQIFLPNLKATSASYMGSFMLSKREFTLIKNTDPSTRFFLVKQGVDAIIARVNLKGMNDFINVLSGNASSVRLLDQIRKEVGDNPDDWLNIFLEKVSET